MCVTHAEEVNRELLAFLSGSAARAPAMTTPSPAGRRAWRPSSSAPSSSTASSIPGREIVQVLTEIPCGVESGWHIHPGEEVGYILAGTVEMSIRGSPR